MLVAENLRPHYARTLWDWSDALKARLDEARHEPAADGNGERAEKNLRAYRLCLAGSAMSFELGWLSLIRILASRPCHTLQVEKISGAEGSYFFRRE